MNGSQPYGDAVLAGTEGENERARVRLSRREGRRIGSAAETEGNYIGPGIPTGDARSQRASVGHRHFRLVDIGETLFGSHHDVFAP